jgi:tRNA threonylcarbamoyladenosine biosynthesis protein TsaB
VTPLILAVDTAGEHGGLVLARGGELIEEVALHAPGGFSGVLYAAMGGLLARHGVRPSEIACFAAASGPGSFTGVRVGIACVKGLAEALNRPAIGVSNLRALARCGSKPLRGVVIDARRRDIYGAVYDDAGKIVSPEVVMRLELWLQTLPPEVDEFISAGDFPLPNLVRAPQLLAKAVAGIAFEKLERGEVEDPAALDANYVRRSDAELFWKE